MRRPKKELLLKSNLALPHSRLTLAGSSKRGLNVSLHHP